MTGQMPASYFEEKKGLAIDSLQYVSNNIEAATRLMDALHYGMTDLVNPIHVHDLLKGVEGLLKDARVNYEKARWAAANTNMEFDPWLVAEGQGELLVDTPKG